MSRRVRRIAPFVISVLLVVVLVSYAPWGDVARHLGGFDLSLILILLVLSLAYHGLKTVRFWYLLQAMDIHESLKIVALSYMSAQPVSLLPAGEIYRSHELKRHTGVPLEKSLPQFTMQGILEGTSMGTLMLISALALGTLRIPALAVSGIVLLCVIAISRGYVANVTRQLNKLPFINMTEQAIENFSKTHKAVLTWHWLPFLYGMSIVIELVGAGIAYASVVGFGPHIDFYQACLVYIIPVIVGFVSLLPGGIGLSEQSAIGVLLLSDVKIAEAVAATLIMRVAIVGMGVLYGVIALVISRLKYPKLADLEKYPT